MSIKLTLLKSGEQVLSDASELISSDDKDKVYGYLFKNPHKVVSTQPLLLTEEQKDDNSLEVTLSPWIILSADKEIVVPTDWVVSIVEPLESVIQMYQEKVNGKGN